MNLLILEEKKVSIDSFIEYWKDFYEFDENYDIIYFENIKPINELTEDNIQKLFNWKNETKRIWEGKQKSIDKIKAELTSIKNKFNYINNSDEDFKKIFDYSLEKFFTSGYIWNLFLLHILKYEYCPIADRYAYIAFKYICFGEYNEFSDDKWQTWNTYLDYKNFFNEIATQTNRCTLRERKEIDEALWGFGKFLDNYPKIILDGGKID